MPILRSTTRSWSARLDVATELIREVAAEVAAEAVRAGDDTFDPIASLGRELAETTSDVDFARRWLSHIDTTDLGATA